MKRRRRILLAFDHPIVLEGLHRILEPAFEIVGEVLDGRALVAAAAQLLPDLIVADVAMPLMNGIEAARRIRTASPEVKIVFLSMYPDVDHAVEALSAGGSAYVLKNSAASEILAAIRESLRGRIYVAHSIGTEPVLGRLGKEAQENAGIRRLTERQREALQLFAEGRSRKEVAAILNVSIKTAEFHKYQLMKKLGFRTGAELTKYAVRVGMISL